MDSYYKLLARLHAHLRPRTYVEIGVRTGRSLTLARWSLNVGVDPELEIYEPIDRRTKLYPLSSDEFFEKVNVREELAGQPVDLAFIDGMHLFEFALRDFIHLEGCCARESIIVVHDCFPVDRITSARERVTEVWTGDIWKLVVCLKKYRPDLRIATIDVPPSGLGVIGRLDPRSNLLASSYESLCEEFIALDYTFLNEDKEAKLNRVPYHWKKIVSLLPQKPYQKGRSTPTARRKRRHSRLRMGLKVLSRYPGKILSHTVSRNKRKRPRALGVLLCYNDADILDDAIEWLLQNNHDIIVWDHGSDDGTAEVLDKYNKVFVERRFIARDFDFYKLYGAMSTNLIENHISHYDWISWPDQDEFLEGPSRDMTYYEYITELFNYSFDWVRFNNFNFWFTKEDNPRLTSPVKRIRRYCLFREGARRIRCWRASVTNIREFNHNPLKGAKFPINFNLRHYPMRSHERMLRRIYKDRDNIARGAQNVHYNSMKRSIDRLLISPQSLHYDDGGSELNHEVCFEWREIYRDDT